jgi:hypothetical protein
MDCYTSTGDVTSWTRVSTVANATTSRWEDPTAVVLEGAEAGDILLAIEDEPGAAGDTSDNAIRFYHSDDDGVTWTQALANLTINAGDHEPGALTYVDLADGSRELRLYFSTPAQDVKVNNAQYSNAQIGYVVLTPSGSSVTDGDFHAIKLRRGRDTDPEGGVGVEALQLANGNVLLSWFSLSTVTTALHQMIIDPDTQGVVGMVSTFEPSGYDSGNNADVQAGSGNALQMNRTSTSNVQHCSFALGAARPNVSIEADVWKDIANAGLHVSAREGAGYLVRMGMQSSAGGAAFKPGEFAYSVDGGNNYNSLDTLTLGAAATWYNLRVDFTDSTNNLSMDTWIDEVAKSVDDLTAARTVGIDEVWLQVDNHVATNKLLFNNFIAREITPDGDVTVSSWEDEESSSSSSSTSSSSSSSTSSSSTSSSSSSSTSSASSASSASSTSAGLRKFPTGKTVALISTAPIQTTTARP